MYLLGLDKLKYFDTSTSKIRLNEVGTKINIDVSGSNVTKWCC